MELTAKLRNQQPYVDTNIIIYLVEGLSEYAKLLKEIRILLENNQLRLVTSELSMAECLVRPFKFDESEVVSIYLTFLEDSGCFELLPVRNDILIQAARIAAKSRVKLPDAIHLSTAAANDCQLFLTNDKGISTPRGIEKVLFSDYL